MEWGPRDEPLEAWILRAVTGLVTDDDLILRARGFIFLLIGGHMLLDFSRNLVHVRYLSLSEDIDAISDEYIRWYQGITWVYIGNPTNRDTCSVGYQPSGTSMLQEVEDMASAVIQEPPSSLSPMAIFAKKVQTIIRRCMTFPIQPLHHRPQEHVPDWGARGVKWGTRRQPDRGAGGGRPPVPSFSGRHEQCRSQACKGGGRHCKCLPLPILGFVPFQSPHPTSFGFSGFCAPSPPGTAGSPTPHQPISQVSSSDEEERTDDTDVIQHLGFRHRVGKKIMRFTPFDWP
ncbi:hypothetical protein M9H77_02365 [Catharanthus roseus]|uniref:Uncharacterized protein n=1 Tax=Catharanthus roseus TaxID=4058 RepID=A0ACC0C8L1_CATRO|nr:hypothetical protein M9H77_02365 [Catharanthus roseus]